MNLQVSIPTYWGRQDGHQPADRFFDHPTPLGSEDTLGRALESLLPYKDQLQGVIIVAAATADDIAPQVEESVKQIIVSTLGNELPHTLVCQRSLLALQQSLKQSGSEDLINLLSLDGYSAIRNMQLVAARILGADAVVLLDDDEVVEDPNFFARLKAHLADGKSALAGYYKNPDGGYLLKGTPTPWEERWGKLEAMNEGFTKLIGGQPGLQPTPFAFGGNMLIGREVFIQVPFDPCVPRGEDIDYLINARFAGIEFLLDNQLAITHLPPPNTQPQWQKLRLDMERFVYEQAKLAQGGLCWELFNPYPGPFVGEDLQTRAQETLEILLTHYREQGALTAAQSTEDTIQYIAQLSYPRAYPEYALFAKQWRELMQVLKAPDFGQCLLSLSQ